MTQDLAQFCAIKIISEILNKTLHQARYVFENTNKYRHNME